MTAQPPEGFLHPDLVTMHLHAYFIVLSFSKKTWKNTQWRILWDFLEH